MGVKKDSDEWRRTVGEGLYLWFEFPRKKEWQKYPAAMRRKTFAALDGLNKPQFAGLKKYLVQNGGGGDIYSTALGGEQYSPAAIRSRSDYSFPFSYFLYAAFDTVGLEPTFVEMEDIWPNRFRCGMLMTIRYGVGFRLSSGWRVFDPYGHNYNAEEGVFYPVSLRQVSSAKNLLSKVGTAIAKREPIQLNSEILFQRDGAGPITVASHPYVNQPTDQSKKWMNDLLTSPNNVLPPILAGFFGTATDSFSCEKAPVLFEEFERRGILGPYAQFFRRSACVDEENWSQAASFARRILEADPLCYEAHSTLAFAGTSGQTNLDDNEIETHFTAAYEALPANHEKAAKLNLNWGAFKLKRGEKAKAREKFLTAYNQRAADEEDRSRAAYYLAHLSAGDGNFSEASSWLKKAADDMVEDLRKDASTSNAVDWFEFFKEENVLRPPAAWIGNSTKLADIAAGLFTELGHLLAFRKKYAEAKEIYEMSMRLNVGLPAKIRVMNSLHETLLQMGDIKSADGILDEMEKIAHAGK